MHARLLFFDTETNGLPTNYKAPPTQIDQWPEIVSLAWEVWTIEGTEWTQIASESHKVQPPEGIRWNAEAERIHGISYEQARSEGRPIQSLLDAFQHELYRASHVIAHNIAFDKSVVLASMLRHKGTTKWCTGKSVCTMMETVAICKILSTSPYATAADPYKWPRLQELHHFLFKKEWDGPAHDALSDVQCMRTCYRELVARGCLAVA
jgi:DNA polymerase III epsilon subunit-like protein